ncbi:MAG: hypothetical protein ACJ74Y_10490 [Bryobacteraceae bacterium]
MVKPDLHMQPTPNVPEGSEAPLYVRWGPSSAPYAIELKLNLVGKIRNLLSSAPAGTAEIGGALVGSLPNSYSPTLRVEDVEMIGRSDADASTFIIDPSQENRVEEVRLRARETGRSVVGLFRSHKRAGALRPSLADRGLIASLFSEPVCVLLLVEGSEPHSAAFFVGQNRQLPADPSVREFRFDEREFKLLPEVELEPVVPRPVQKQRPIPKRNVQRAWMAVAALIVVALISVILQGSRTGRGIPLLRSDELDLRASREGPGLRISWNNASRAFDQASGARLVIKREGMADETIQLGLDELRLGAVEIENSTPRVDLTLEVEAPGSSSATQSVRWQGQ